MTMAHDVYAVLKLADRPLRTTEIAARLNHTAPVISGRLTDFVRRGIVISHGDRTYSAGPTAPAARPCAEPGHVTNRWLAMQQLRHGPLTSDELADLLDVLKAKVCGVLTPSMRAGHVVFDGTHYSLTEAGVAVAESE